MWLRANDTDTTLPEDLGFKKFLPTEILANSVNSEGAVPLLCTRACAVAALCQNLYGVLPKTRGPLCGAMLTVLFRVYVRPPPLP